MDINRYMAEGLLTSPLSMPARRAGKLELTVEPIAPHTKLTLISNRTAILGGVRPASITCPDPMEIRRLLRDGDVLMSDCPQEMMDHAPFIAKARGRVLVTGLGLGYVAAQLATRRAVSEILVVDNDADIIRFITPHLKSPKIAIVHDDACAMLRRAKPGHFHSAWLDTWFGTGEVIFMTEIAPQCRLARAARIPHVDYWGRLDVEGQLKNYVFNVFIEQYEHDNWKPRVVFRRALMARARRRAVDARDAEELAVALARPYTATWERTFGRLWDETEKGAACGSTSSS